MKLKILVLVLVLLVCNAQTVSSMTAKSVLDKTAALICSKSGSSANFTISNTKLGKSSGTIYVKGNKFFAKIPAGMVWYNGKTQWTYITANEEVNVTNPTKEQQQAINPMTFVYLYKKGYKATLNQKGNEYIVSMIGSNNKKNIGEMIILIDKKTFAPTKIKMRQGETWTDIVIRNFKQGNYPDSMFQFNAKDFPQAEIIDLR